MNDNSQQPIMPQSPTPEQQKSQYNWLRTLTIGFGIVSIGISIALGGYALGTKKSQPIKLKPVPISISPTAVTSNETSSDTSTWKTYVIDYSPTKLNFRYPLDWNLILPKGNGCGPMLQSNNLKNISFTICGYFGNNETPESLSNLLGNTGSGESVSRNNIIIDTKKGIRTEINYKDASRQIYIHIGDIDSTVTHGDETKTVNTGTVAIGFNRASTMEYDEIRKIFDQILSTFKFTN